MTTSIHRQIHVNLPFRLMDTYLETFLERRLNPEIDLDQEEGHVPCIQSR